MKFETFRRFCSAHIKQCFEMGEKKGLSYANDDDNRLNNFYRDGKALGIVPEANLLVHAGKHWAAINYYVRQGCPKDSPDIPEPIVGRIYDLMNYMLLLLGLLEERHNGDQFEKIIKTKEESVPKEDLAPVPGNITPFVRPVK